MVLLPARSEAARSVKKEETKTEANKEKTQEAPAANLEPKFSVVYGQAKKVGNNLSIIFPWHRDVGAAMFVRGSYLWVVFSEVSELKIQNFVPDEIFSKYEEVPSSGSSILRFKFTDPLAIDKLSFNINLDETTWQIEIQGTAGQTVVRKPLQVNSAPDKVTIPVLKTTDPIKVRDPEVGDDIVIVPIMDGSTGIMPTRRFVDFNLLQTLQGVVIYNLSDNTEYSSNREGVEISSAAGLKVSAVKPKEGEEGKAENHMVKTLLPFDRTGVGDFVEDTNNLLEQISNLPVKNRSAKRLELAQLYFKNRFYPDAYGVLSQIKNADPEFMNSLPVQFLYGATLYQMRHYTDALRTFLKLEAATPKDNPNLPEVKAWRWASNIHLGEDAKDADWQAKVSEDKEFVKLQEQALASKEDVFTPGKSFILQYPPYISNPMLLAAAREKISQGNFDAAQSLLEEVFRNSPTSEQANSANFLRGVVQDKAGNFSEAEVAWRKVAKDIDDRRNRMRSELYLTNLELNQGRVTKEEAIKKIEPLTMIWRGGQPELELLNYLAQLYYSNKQYAKAFQTWKALITSFPNTSEAADVAAKMQDYFVKLFDGGDAYQMPPVEALSLYFEFRELTPLGPRGDKIIRQLADHFVDADLLESAATLLTHQIRYRSEGNEKLDLVEKLVEVDLLNRKPGEALEVLQGTDNEKMNEERRQRRKYLKAEILRDMGKRDDALKLLDGDNSKRAKEIEEGIYWDSKQWGKVIKMIEPQFANRKETYDNLDERETEQAVRLAFAYAFVNENAKLEKFGRDYSSLLSNPSDKKFFDFLTKGEKKLDVNNLDETTKVDDIAAYLIEYNKTKLKKPAKPENAGGAGGTEESAGSGGAKGPEPTAINPERAAINNNGGSGGAAEPTAIDPVRAAANNGGAGGAK